MLNLSILKRYRSRYIQERNHSRQVYFNCTILHQRRA